MPVDGRVLISGCQCRVVSFVRSHPSEELLWCDRKKASRMSYWTLSQRNFVRILTNNRIKQRCLGINEWFRILLDLLKAICGKVYLKIIWQGILKGSFCILKPIIFCFIFLYRIYFRFKALISMQTNFFERVRWKIFYLNKLMNKYLLPSHSWYCFWVFLTQCIFHGNYVNEINSSAFYLKIYRSLNTFHFFSGFVSTDTFLCIHKTIDFLLYCPISK